MAQDTKPQGRHRPKRQKLENSYEILTCTAKSASFSYIHLQLLTTPSANTTSAADPELDNLQLSAYCTSALRQFLGLTGAAVPVDILKVHGADGWVRVPRQDLSLFAAAVTAWRGEVDDGELRALRVVQCADWLGAMVGHDGQDRLWNP